MNRGLAGFWIGLSLLASSCAPKLTTFRAGNYTCNVSRQDYVCQTHHAPKFRIERDGNKVKIGRVTRENMLSSKLVTDYGHFLSYRNEDEIRLPSSPYLVLDEGTYYKLKQEGKNMDGYITERTVDELVRIIEDDLSRNNIR